MIKIGTWNQQQVLRWLACILTIGNLQSFMMATQAQSIRLEKPANADINPTTTRPMATVVGAVNSTINDSNAERIYLLPVNYNLPKANHWLELRPPSLFRSNPKNTPLTLTEQVGIAFFGTKGSYNLKVSLYFKGNLINSCYQPQITEEVKENVIDIKLENRWHPLLFCDSKNPKPIENVYRVLNANLPGQYTIKVNGKTIGNVEFTLESNKIKLNLYNKNYTLEGVTQILLFTPPPKTE